MCGRYFIDEETAQEIEEIIKEVDARLKTNFARRDVYPSNTAAVLVPNQDKLSLDWQNWGFPGFEGKKLIINARAETAMDRRMFRDNVRNRRCVIPARGFYEWDKEKNKVSFERTDEKSLFMAGCYQRFGEESRFVILTTAANPSVSPVHGRMPLILEREAVTDWLFNEERTEEYLHREPCLLKRRMDYYQESLFDL